MPPISLRLQLLTLSLAGLALAALVTAFAGWLASDAFLSSDADDWLIGAIREGFEDHHEEAEKLPVGESERGTSD